MARRVDQDVCRAIRVRKRICVVSMVMPWSRSVWQRVEQERPFERHAAALAAWP